MQDQLKDVHDVKASDYAFAPSWEMGLWSHGAERILAVTATRPANSDAEMQENAVCSSSKVLLKTAAKRPVGWFSKSPTIWQI